jgi:hypothetical protein
MISAKSAESHRYKLHRRRGGLFPEDTEGSIMLKDTLYERFGLHSQDPYDQCKTLAF